MNDTSQGLGPIESGSTVVVIGGGPGGTAAAISLKQGARALGRDLRVILVEGKQFNNGKHHNLCAGVLSPPIAAILEHDLGVPFPWSLCQRTINRYILHTARRQIELNGEGESSYALRRVQFDAYMLEAAQERGIEVLQARVTDLEIHADRAIIYTDSSPLTANVVVGAFGLDEGSATIFHRAVGYRPPLWLSTVVTKFHPQPAFLERFTDDIHVFLPAAPGIEFGAITPKGNHLTLNIAGSKANLKMMDTFLSLPEVQAVLPTLPVDRCKQSTDLCYFKGRFPRGLAANTTGDRFIMVGDAAGLVRAFKGKGVTSAIQTGIRAADVILHKGISTAAFQEYHRANQDILSDLPYGQAMRLLTIAGSRCGLMDVAIDAAKKNPELRQAFFDAVSAHRPYQNVVRRIFSPSSMAAITRAMIFNGAH